MTDASDVTAAGWVNREVRDSVVVRFAGDSGDGMQLAGTQFTMENALAGGHQGTLASCVNVNLHQVPMIGLQSEVCVFA